MDQLVAAQVDAAVRDLALQHARNFRADCSLCNRRERWRVVRDLTLFPAMVTLQQAIGELGGLARYEGDTLTVDARPIAHCALTSPAAGQIHGSVYLAPALLARFGEATVPAEGGCRIGDGSSGDRPTEHYISIL